jgi:hypothetical protein
MSAAVTSKVLLNETDVNSGKKKKGKKKFKKRVQNI